MDKPSSSYIAKPLDANGHVAYTKEENETWQTLITRQSTIIQNRACDEYIKGLSLLNLPRNRVPQCGEITDILQQTTGWSLEPVAALISDEHFFHLLANKKFPAATFIRRADELNYLQEPDIFHEMFGHCPLLTNAAYADFAHNYGKLALKANQHERMMLARLYWFTVEFGLILGNQGLRAYGGGILSSMNETVYCVESDKPIRKPFDVIEVLRTPYRIDIMQPIYFVINSFDTLFHLISVDLIELIDEATKLGMHEPIYK